MIGRLRAESSAGSGRAEREKKQKLLSASLEQRIDRLENMYRSLSRTYDESARGKLEKYFCDIGAWFHRLAFSYRSPYREWIDLSKKSKALAKESKEKAYQVAAIFEMDYSRTRCRKCITDLVESIRNLKIFNDRR